MSVFTREVLDGLTKCNTTRYCSHCSAHSYCKTHVLVQKTADLARALLAEMDKPKDDVWKDAPENAVRSLTYFYDANRAYISEIECTRTLPKPRARVIAEEFFDSEAYIGFCEIAILKALAEQEAGKC